jgi:hypothetical protein
LPSPESRSPDARADHRLGASFVEVLLRPASALPTLARDPSARSGASAVALLGIAWSALLILLWSGGHAPSFVLLPIAPESYYVLQALAMLPILTALWWIHSEIAHRLCRAAGGSGEEGGVRTALGFAYAAPMLVAHVLPELVAYVAGGFELMAAVGRVSLALAALWVWALSAAALRIAHGVRLPVAIGASLAGLLVQALAGGLVIR